jgi:hypothetical protein
MLSPILTLSLEASPIAVGANVGADFPLARRAEVREGISAEAFYRRDPYEIRFHYGNWKVDSYSVTFNRKHFFSQAELRPYLEAGIGPIIINTPSEGLSYGVTPVGSLGVELGLSDHFSGLVAMRYSAYMVFGDTAGGSWESNHYLSLLGGVSLWF